MNEANANTDVVRELTFGERAVGITFNPGGHEDVNNVKAACAAAIDAMANATKSLGKKLQDALASTDSDEERAKIQAEYDEALEQITLGYRKVQEGQMWAVKGVTWVK
jgi:hypothetical protein